MNNDQAKLRERLDFIQRGRDTERFHTLPTLSKNRVDAHSYGVAMLTTIIVPRCSEERRARLLMAGLVHDLPEEATGDMPAPSKRAIPGMRKKLNAYEDTLLDRHGLLFELGKRDARVLALADCADGALFCCQERAMGNKASAKAFHNFWNYMKEEQDLAGTARENGDLGLPFEEADQCVEEGELVLHHYIHDQWKWSNGGEW